MIIRRTATAVEVHTPAKLNLYFAVLRRRGDGFHEVETILCPVSLYDSLRVRPRPAAEIVLQWDASPLERTGGADAAGAVATGDENLVVRAARLLQSRAKVPHGAHIALRKRIPAAAGLGGGSSDAAATLAACNLAWGLHWERAQLVSLAAELGSDVPAFLQRGPSIGRGRGELLEAAPSLGHWHCVLVSPARGLSTPEVFRSWCREEDPPSLSAALAILVRADWKSLPAALHNGLESAARRLAPWMEQTRGAFTRVACHARAMTGSGSSWFGVCRTARQARRLGVQLRSRGVGAVHVVRCHM